MGERVSALEERTKCVPDLQRDVERAKGAVGLIKWVIGILVANTGLLLWLIAGRPS